jgi:hypothetical protein
MVQLLEAHSNLDVAYGANIKGKATWKNISLNEGASLAAAFVLGKGGNIYGFSYGGVEYILGSIVAMSAPAPNMTVTTEIPSKTVSEGIWDAQVLIGFTTGTIRTLQFDGRIVGLNAEDLAYLSYYTAAWFTGVLNVAAPTVAAEVTAFEFVAG